MGSYESCNGDDKDNGNVNDMWNTLGLLDVHSILVDEGDSTGGGGSMMRAVGDGHEDNGSQGSAAQTTSSSGFFSITANDGAVHVFEAPSGKKRDYVVLGLRSVISRLTYHVVAGDANVIGELYSEDAGQLTGELPSLITPWKALTRVTHAFVDKN